MSSELDVPNLPFPKPIQLERLEKIRREQWNAMDEVEVNEHVQEAADGMAYTYRKTGGNDYNMCISIIISALTEMGGALGGEAGAFMVGNSTEAAHQACRVAFPEDEVLP
jgi:hypothetical protein